MRSATPYRIFAIRILTSLAGVPRSPAGSAGRRTARGAALLAGACLLGSLLADGIQPPQAAAQSARPTARGIHRVRAIGRHRHPRFALSHVLYSPDGRWLVSASDTGLLHVYDERSRKEVQTLVVHAEAGQREGTWVESVAFSPDGSLLAAGGDAADPVAHIWDATTWRELARLEGFGFHVDALAFHPDGQTLATGSTGIRIWDLRDISDGTVREVKRLPGHAQLTTQLAYSPDGARLASAGFDGVIRIRSVPGYEVLREIPEPRIYDPKRKGDSELEANCMCLRFSPDGREIATGHYFLDDIVAFDVASGKRSRVFHGHTNGAITFDYSPDGLRLVSGGHDQTVRFWRVADGKLLKTQHPRGWDVMNVRFSPDGQSLAAALTDGRIARWRWRFEAPGEE